MLNLLLLPILSISYFCLMIHAHAPRYFLENTSMEDIDEGIEEGFGESTMLKEREAQGQTYSAKKARAATPPSAPLKAKNSLHKHFYTKTVELRMVKLIDKPILTEKMITQESLEQYNVMKLLLGMGCLELALFAEQYNENLVKEFYANLTEEFGNSESPTYEEEADFDEITKVLTGDAGAVWAETNRLNSSLMKIPHIVLFIKKDQYLYCYFQKHHQVDRPKEEASKHQVGPPSPPPSSAEAAEVTTCLDLLNQQLSNVIASVLQMQQDLKNLKDKIP
ncbi:hypothetical protein M9H77_18295 [Catharanthus roseus]|uniref:Uncharacterized protein n=1 Tax=Catharanthus roseus TaxID=4058 RepID=A0ACC0B729_CATRO|nr:hypothetical protein M9H77_18295 [Catharanthus roseus]